ncbi:hypothetical protein OEZ85_013768 [Tetradesmus obliquus]|uniref:SBP-type domain-containing protein n=1 Tax=Tetradesmus obliquus TaxID=3088 RepID=A0ABY8U9T4_TETOB|nr:hypothetical protein OEZ85_013768 [Tetradesmus obliquus]
MPPWHRRGDVDSDKRSGMADDSARTEPAVVNSSSPLAQANSHMEWEASEHKWDAHSMQAQRSASSVAAAEATSGRRSARAAAVAAAAATAASTVKASKVKRNTGELICQVPGCGVSLEGTKEYHQRYRVCPQHAKVDALELHGVASRFCQQCGKFHELSQFDGARHSCRQQLQRHNALRRRAAPISKEQTSVITRDCRAWHLAMQQPWRQQGRRLLAWQQMPA